MDLLTRRYRSLTILLVILVVQLLLLGYQVRSRQNVRLLRVWAVTAISPAARALEAVRRGGSSIIDHYFVLVGVQRENDRLKSELRDLQLEALQLRSELSSAKRAEALKLFRDRTPSRTVAARIIGAGTGLGSQVVFLDRGSGDGVRSGMAVITPGGIVGRVLAAYPTSSQVLLVTDRNFAAGVISQRNHVEGTLKGWGRDLCTVDYIANDAKLDVGEWFFTSGDDRVFPRGIPVGQVEAVREGSGMKQVYVRPSGLRGGVEEALIVLEGAHQPIGEATQAPPKAPPLLDLPDASREAGASGPSTNQQPALSTDADRLFREYRALGAAQGHRYGEGGVGTPPPDFRSLPREQPPPPARHPNPEQQRP